MDKSNPKLSIVFENLLYIVIIIIIIAICIRIYRLTTAATHNDNDKYLMNNIENFQNSISKLKNNKKNKIKSKSESKSLLEQKLKTRKGDNGATFDDIITQTEKMDIEKYTISNLKDSFWDYVDSFKTEKFNNVSGTNNEALEKLYMFKDKFFEIFE